MPATLPITPQAVNPAPKPLICPVQLLIVAM
jgi:hypothetical protein